MEEATEQSESARWKRKYYDQVAELDRLEKEWQATESLLARAVARLGGMASGQDPDLDALIQKIRSSVSGGVEAARLKPLVDQLFDSLVRDRHDAPEPSEVARELLQQVELPAVLESERQDLLTRLTREHGSPHANVSETLRLLARALPGSEDGSRQSDAPSSRPLSSDPNADDPNEFRGMRNGTLCLLQRLSADSAAPGIPADLEKTAGNATSIDELHAVIDRLATTLIAPCGHDGSDDELVSHTRETLLHLIEQLEVPADFQSSMDKLKVRLQAAVTKRGLQSLIADLAQLINTLRGSLQIQKQELQQFLVRVNDRIEALVGLLGRGDEELEDQAARKRDFDHGVDQHIESMRRAVDDATDTTELKKRLEQGLDDMTQRLLEQRRAEDERIRRDRERIEVMRGRLSELERESTTLRETVDRKTEEAMVDPLTGIPNRLAYDKRITEEFQRWQRFGMNLSIGLIDVDRFKELNDTYGHQAGDNALRVIATLLRARLRSIDFIARYGGEEFVLVFPGTEPEDALGVLEDMRGRVESASFHYRQQPISITISGGVAGFGPDDTIHSALERADSALYTAKSKGRNRCETGEDARFTLEQHGR